MNFPPDDCTDFLRGIVNDDHYDGTGFDHSIFSEVRPIDIDGLENWKGASINWDLPGGDALGELLMRTRRNGEIQFKFGAIRIPRSALDGLVKRYNNEVLYEIRPENGNEYHGHILIDKGMEKSRRYTFGALLANAFTEIHRQEDTDS